jgi:hypothetical protein
VKPFLLLSCPDHIGIDVHSHHCSRFTGIENSLVTCAAADVQNLVVLPDIGKIVEVYPDFFQQGINDF